MPRHRLTNPRHLKPSWRGSTPRASAVDQLARMLRQRRVPFPEFCARFHSHDRGAAWIHKFWRSPQAPPCCSACCPVLLGNGPARLSCLRGRAVRCLLAATDQQPTEQGSESPLLTKPPAVQSPVRDLSRTQERPQDSRRLARLLVPKLVQRALERHNTTLQRRSLPAPESQPG